MSMDLPSFTSLFGSMEKIRHVENSRNGRIAWAAAQATQKSLEKYLKQLRGTIDDPDEAIKAIGGLQ